MPGFETIVRPAVLPNIRPIVPRVLVAEDSPEKGICTISGGAPQTLGTSRNWSVSLSRDRPQVEVARQFNKERVYQMDSNGNINKSNFVDVERLSRVKMNDEEANKELRLQFAQPPQVDNIKTIEADVTRNA